MQRTKDAADRVEPAPDRDRDSRLQARISDIDRTINKELHSKQVPPNYRNEANAVADENKALRKGLDVKRGDVTALTNQVEAINEEVDRVKADNGVIINELTKEKSGLVKEQNRLRSRIANLENEISSLEMERVKYEQLRELLLQASASDPDDPNKMNRYER